MILAILLGLVQSSVPVELNPVFSTDTVPFKRLYHTMDYNNETNTLVIFGGQRGLTFLYNDVWMYSLSNSKYSLIYPTNEFAPGNLYSAARSNSGCFVDPSTNTLYIFAGLSEKGPQNDLWSFSLSGYQWKREKPFGQIPNSRYRFGYTKFYWNGNLKFAVFGGSLAAGESNSLYLFDVESKTWTKMTNKTEVLPPKLNGPSIEYFNGYIYVVTGEETSGDDPYFNGLYRYSLVNQTWEELNPSGSYISRYFSATGIIDDKLYVLFGWTNYESIDLGEISYIDLNLLDEWKVLNNENCESRDSYSASVVNNHFYLFGGYKAETQEYLNSLIDLNNETDSKWQCSTINIDYEVPPARQYHSMSSINGELYLYGGQGESGVLGDMWILNSQQKWSSVDITGDSPPARYGHSHGSDGDMIFIWGGNSASGLLNDFYIFTTVNNTWTKIEPSGTMPSPKTGACLALNIPHIYIFGGNSNAGLSNELWVYSMSENIYSQLSLKNPPSPRYFTNCEYIDDSLWVMLGTSVSDIPLGDIHKLNMTTKEWSLVAKELYPPQARSVAVVKHFNSFILILGGQGWTTDPYNQIYTVDIENKTFTHVGNLPIYFYAGAFSVIKTTLYINGGGSVLGNTLRLSVPSLSFNTFDLKQLEVFNKICSPGSYYNEVNSICEVCKAGFYSSGYLNKVCTPCPPGTYNSNSGATSQRQCYPCPYGTYSNRENATYCLQCPVGMNCPIGSTSYYEESLNVVTNSIQPTNYSPKNSLIEEKKTIIYTLIPAIFIVIMLLFLVFPFVRKLIIGIDMYKEHHNYELLKPMYMFKNKTGGVFFLMFFLTAVFVISLSWTLFEYDNIIEDKTLLPMAVLNEINDNIIGTVGIKIEFSNYGDECDGKGGFSPLFKFDFQTSSISASQFSGRNYKKDKSCIVEFKCIECKIIVGDKISLEFQEEDSYCSSISVNITSDSSIPDLSSTMAASVTANSYKVFRGYIPTQFYFKITPSLFKSYVSEYKDDTGYHVSVDNNPKSGSEYLISEIAFSSGLKLEINLNINNYGLYTERNYKQSALSFLATLLGSVFGIMGAFEGVMRVFESNVKILRTKLNNRSNISELNKERFKHKEMLGDKTNRRKKDQDLSSETDLLSPRV